MYAYTVFGLNIHSEIALPSLPPGHHAADVVIKLGVVTPPALQRGRYGLWYSVTPETTYIRWEGVGDFHIQGGCEITVMPDPTVLDHSLQRFILGSALGSTLFQRGQLALHASAVVGPTGAIAFIGESGWGKSTLAAGLHARGYRMLADDLLAVRAGTERHLVFPGLPEFKLWPDTLSALGEDRMALAEVFPGQEKRIRPVSNNRQCDPTPLDRLYVLGCGEQHEIVPLSPNEVIFELVRHTYGIGVFHPIGPRQHFLQCTSLAQSTPALCLKRRRISLDELPALLDIIEDDIRNHD